MGYLVRTNINLRKIGSNWEELAYVNIKNIYCHYNDINSEDTSQILELALIKSETRICKKKMDFFPFFSHSLFSFSYMGSSSPVMSSSLSLLLLSLLGGEISETDK